MAHFARIKNGIVDFVTSGRDEDENREDELAHDGWIYKRTSYNTKRGIHYNPQTGLPSNDQSKAFRKNYAGKNMIYNEEIDGFIIPQPYSSWTLNSETGIWHAPTPYPDDGNAYNWNEETQEWDLIVSE